MWPQNSKIPFPVPNIWGKVGTGKGFSDSLGKIWGLGEVNFEEFLGTNPLKILKFEVGTRAMILGIIGESLFFPKLEKCHFIFHDLLLSHTPFLSLLSIEKGKIC